MDTDSTRWLKLRSGSDIRGPETQLTDEMARKIGYAFACWLASRRNTTPDALKIAVGRDSRESGVRLMRALIRGITAADSDVLDCGLCAAPALFMTVCVNQAETAADGAVMVTADHQAQGMNGFKFITASAAPGESGGLTDADVATILRMASVTEVPERLVTRRDLMPGYRGFLRQVAARYLEDDALKPLLGMRVVVDASNGAGGFFAEFLEELGAETTGSCNLEPNGDFPGHQPAPDDPKALSALKQAVLDNRADLGVIFDVDCDRASIVDQDGRFLGQNRLIALMAAMLLENHPGATFVTDSVTSSGLSAFIAEWGGIHYRFKRGYRNVIDEAIRLNAEGIDCPLAIETSGHAAFRENGFIDDGIYLALRVICEALNRKREGETLSALIGDLQEPVESMEIRLPILEFEDWTPEEQVQQIVEIILSHTLEHPEWHLANDNREGVRIMFNLDDGVNNAWFQLRKSVHDPVVALNAESDVPGGVKRMLGWLCELIGDTELLDTAPLKDALKAQ